MVTLIPHHPDELERRARALLANHDDLVMLQRHWREQVGAGRFASLPPERQQAIAVDAACGILGVPKNEVSRQSAAVHRLAAALRGDLPAPSPAPVADEGGISRQGAAIFLGIGAGLVCLALSAWLLGLGLLIGSAWGWVKQALASGRPAWVRDWLAKHPDLAALWPMPGSATPARAAPAQSAASSAPVPAKPMRPAPRPPHASALMPPPKAAPRAGSRNEALGLACVMLGFDDTRANRELSAVRGLAEVLLERGRQP